MGSRQKAFQTFALYHHALLCTIMCSRLKRDQTLRYPRHRRHPVTSGSLEPSRRIDAARRRGGGLRLKNAVCGFRFRMRRGKKEAPDLSAAVH